MKAVIGFNRDRDSYQVPLALVENGSLGGFVTDYYVGASRPQVAALAHRVADGLPADLVHTSRAALIAQIAFQISQRLPFLPNIPFPSRIIDSAIAGRISRTYSKVNADTVFAYSNYAYKSFATHRDAFKVLFQYHPGSRWVAKALQNDELRDAADWEKEIEIESRHRARIYERETSRADRIVVASSFTRAGLVADGIAERIIRVTPYGCPRVDIEALSSRRTARRFLFVGQGVQRKGLHILLEAWRRAGIRGGQLELICPRIDPAIRSIATATRGVELRVGVDNQGVRSAMLGADVLVLPSLVEGFGLVIGEALARGCRVLATSNTGLVDLRSVGDAGRVVKPGDVAQLSAALTEFAETFSDRGLREGALAVAEANSWTHFRQEVRGALA